MSSEGFEWTVVRAGHKLVEDLRVFFFSSRRRHTIFDCDWSSDVCSSDLTVLGVLGTSEVYAFAKQQGIEPLEWVGFLAAAAFPLATYWVKSAADWEPVVYGGAAWLLLGLVAAAARGPTRHPLTALAVTTFGPLYASALLSFIVAIRHGPHADAHPRGAVALVVMPLVITWVCDTCAMTVGTLVGGRQLAPVLSPRKTWAGAIGGLAGGVGAAPLYGPPVPPPGAPPL